MVNVVEESYKTSVTLDDIVNAKYHYSFMGDRASITIDNRTTYTKIGKNKWEHMPWNEHAYGGFYTDKEIYDIVRKANDIKFYEE